MRGLISHLLRVPCGCYRVGGCPSDSDSGIHSLQSNVSALPWCPLGTSVESPVFRWPKREERESGGLCGMFQEPGLEAAHVILVHNPLAKASLDSRELGSAD